MLWGHCIQYCYPTGGDFFLDVAFKVIYSFHMPLLMIVSGYLFAKTYRRYGRDQLLSKKTSAIIRPIVGGSIFIFMFVNVLHSLISRQTPVGLLSGAFLGRLSDLWFLWSVLGATIVMCFTVRASKWYTRLMVLAFGILFVATFPNWSLNLFMYPYFVIGFYYAEYQKILRKFEWTKYLSLLVFPIMVLFYEKKHFIYTSGIYGQEYSLREYIGIDLYRWAIGLVGCVFAITVIQLFLKVKPIQKWGAMVAKLGKKSLQIYVLSIVFLSYYLPHGLHLVRKIGFVNRVYQVCCSHAVLYDMVFTLVITVFYAVALYYLIKLLEKLKLSKLIFGRS